MGTQRSGNGQSEKPGKEMGGSVVKIGSKHAFQKTEVFKFPPKIARKKRSKIPPQSAPIFKFFRFFCKIPRFVLFMGQFFCYGENSKNPPITL